MPYLARCCRGGRRVELNFRKCSWVNVLAGWRVSGSTVGTVESSYCVLCSLCQIFWLVSITLFRRGRR